MSIVSGTVIGGDYRILSRLAAGGMGEIYVAQQLSTGKNRALKLMKPELILDTTLLARFEQEARVSSLIRSDHVVEVVGAGMAPTHQRPWLAMELLDGETLATLLARRGRLPAQEARSQANDAVRLTAKYAVKRSRATFAEGSPSAGHSR